MNEGKVLFDGGIKSQPVDAVKAMIEFFDHKACEQLPKKIMMTGGWWLVLSSRGDEYHLTSREACSCKGFYYRQSCRHVAALRDEAQVKESQKEIKGILLLGAYAFAPTEGEVEYWREKEQKGQGQKQELSPTQIFARDIVAAMGS